MKRDAARDKTNAVRLLDQAGVAYTLHPYEYDESDLAAAHVAEALGQDINRVFKTLVLRGERNGLFVCVVPGNREVDLKKAARAFGDKKADMIPMKDLQPLTGYIRGGCSPVGMKKPLPTFLHLTALDYPAIYLSAGRRGLQMCVAAADLVRVTGATVADIATD